jgi:glycosyltransferase involved in cell wall biosynthesis
MNEPPRVSFILPVYNAAAFLEQTLASLFSQTFEDFEVVAINDGSTDGSGELLRKAAGQDARMRVVERGNRGLVATLNEAIDMARANYLARIDADDVCVPERLDRQSSYLDAFPDVAVVGSATQTFSDDPAVERRVIQHPRDPAAAMLFRSVVAHPSVMMRKDVLDAHGLRYREPYRCAQDYDLWCRCVARGLRIVNHEKVLVHYRVHARQITSALAEETQVEGEAIRNEFLTELGLEPTARELEIHNWIARDQFVADEKFLEDAVGWLINLTKLPASKPVFDRGTLLKVLTGRYVALVRFAKSQGMSVGGAHAEETPFAAYILPGALD